MLRDIEVMWQKTIKHAFSKFDNLIKHSFLTNHSGEQGSIYIIMTDEQLVSSWLYRRTIWFFSIGYRSIICCLYFFQSLNYLAGSRWGKIQLDLSPIVRTRMSKKNHKNISALVHEIFAIIFPFFSGKPSLDRTKKGARNCCISCIGSLVDSQN